MLREIWTPVRCGDGKRSGDGGAEYPCVRRYRHRRLLSFLWLQGFRATHKAMLSESNAMMWVPHLQQMVVRDEWLSAKLYLSRFLVGATSVESMVLSRVVDALSALANIVFLGAGGEEEEELFKHCLDHKHAQTRLRSIMLKAQQARDSIDWQGVKVWAGEILDDLAFETPELKYLTYMPRVSLKPHNVLPIGFGFPRRCRPMKQTRPPKFPAGTVAKLYLVRRSRLQASSDPSQETTCDQRLTLIKALDWTADILDECLEAGKLEVHPIQTTETEGTAAAPVLTWPGIPSVANAVTNAGKLASHVTPTDAPLVQPVFNNLTSNCANSGTGLIENAGKLACHALTPGAQISSTAVDCLTGPAKNSELPLMTNAESGHQGLDLRKNPREEITSSDEQDLHLKRQRTTGAFSHAGLMPAAAIET